jgi:hypothetical protein
LFTVSGALCHPAKGVVDDNLVPRGGGAYLNEVDGNHERALMRTKSEAYRAAGFASVSDQAASSNASKLEREVPAIVARIAYMARDMGGLRQEKRKRLEDRLWLYHDGNVADCWETVDVEVRNKKGEVVLKADGTPKTKTFKRMKDLSQLTPEQQMRIESISVNEAGIATPKLYSASWANSELRKFHALGEDTSNPVQRLSDAELITQLANQAKELGIEIDLSYILGGEQ